MRACRALSRRGMPGRGARRTTGRRVCSWDSLGDDGEHGWQDHEGVRIPGCFVPHGHERLAIVLVEVSHLDEARQEGSPEEGGPLPGRLVGTGDPLRDAEVDDAKVVRPAEFRDAGHDIQIASAGVPGACDGVDDGVEDGSAGGQGHGLIVEVVLDGKASGGAQEVMDGGEDGRGIGQEAEDPSDPRGVESGGEIQRAQFPDIGAVRLDVLDMEGSGRRPDVADESVRFVDGDDEAGGADELGQVEGGVSRAGADIEHARAGLDAGLFPEVDGRLGPEAVLDAQADEFLVVGSEEVFAVVGHGARVGDAGMLVPRLPA